MPEPEAEPRSAQAPAEAQLSPPLPLMVGLGGLRGLLQPTIPRFKAKLRFLAPTTLPVPLPAAGLARVSLGVAGKLLCGGGSEAGKARKRKIRTIKIELCVGKHQGQLLGGVGEGLRVGGEGRREAEPT